MMKQMVVTNDTEVLHTIKSFSNANNHDFFSCAPPPPFSEILDPPVIPTVWDAPMLGWVGLGWVGLAGY